MKKIFNIMRLYSLFLMLILCNILDAQETTFYPIVGWAKGDTMDIFAKDGKVFVSPQINGSDPLFSRDTGLIRVPPMFSIPTGDSLMDLKLNSSPLIMNPAQGLRDCVYPDNFYIGSTPFTYKYGLAVEKKIAALDKEIYIIGKTSRPEGASFERKDWRRIVADSFMYRLLDNINLNFASKYHVEFVIIFDRDGAFRKVYLRDLWIESPELAPNFNPDFENRYKQNKLKLNIDNSHLVQYRLFKYYKEVLNANQRNNFRQKRYTCANHNELYDYFTKSVNKILLSQKDSLTAEKYNQLKLTLDSKMSELKLWYTTCYTVWEDCCKGREKEIPGYSDLLFEKGSYKKKMTVCSPKNIDDFFAQYEFLESSICDKFPTLPLAQIKQNLRTMPPIVPLKFTYDVLRQGSLFIPDGQIHNTALRVFLTKEGASEYYFNLIEIQNEINDF